MIRSRCIPIGSLICVLLVSSAIQAQQHHHGQCGQYLYPHLVIKENSGQPPYRTYRNWQTYLAYFRPFAMGDFLLQQTGGRALEVGAGEGVAMSGLLRSHDGLLSELVVVEPQWGANSLKRHLIDEGPTHTKVDIHEASVFDLPDERLGRFNVIWDVIAAATYDPNGPLEAIKMYVRLLKVNGRAYVYLPSNTSVFVASKNTHILFWDWLSEKTEGQLKVRRERNRVFSGNESSIVSVLEIEKLEDGPLSKLESIEIQKEMIPSKEPIWKYTVSE